MSKIEEEEEGGRGGGKRDGDVRMRNLETMCSDKVVGFDVVIVCTSNKSSEDFWQKRLEDGNGVVPGTTKICVVHEDWNGGAGNGLGTLYAFQKADRKFQGRADNPKGQSLLDAMRKGEVSVSLYHTAGKGTRLAPLPGSESNNKPGVKLPGTISVGGKRKCVTILESVIRQTGLYASSRKGRLSVFWGDQIFVPTLTASDKPTHHADILAMLGEFPSAKEWQERGLEKYGLITVNDKGDASQVEKVSHQTASKLLAGMGKLVSAGTSLGSFSVSSRMLDALLDEFSTELAAKKGKLDTDPHWWMPFTLPQEGYIKLMERKGTSESDARAHWTRMRKFAAAKFADTPHLLGAVDVGSEPYWWDYGQLKYYVSNNLKLTQSSEESKAMRRFFRVPEPKDGMSVDATSILEDGVTMSDGSVSLGSTIFTGRAKGCVLVNCHIGELDAENCVLVNVSASKVQLKNGVIYNVSETDATKLCSPKIDDGSVIVDVCVPALSKSGASHESIRMHSHTSVCGGKSWKEKACGNEHTFEDIYLQNTSSCLETAQKFADIRRSNSDDSITASNKKKIRLV